ncbi:ABC transporter substrate-binding protein [Allokutzneria albata]|uniref:Carbohydrate ABC transporter substrate-binding protein, CUT1 family n=1 Tax=Allokutzneria albata TaxID=211114 RepID=A0A1H0CZ89_ALLAB|nr:sugar ABC transporter substrate-binding protein [Allokutzneria albata]SDN63214.1 carbohydrate ABC transporter substrate-binding protein, CUT1 family [Allokutzneria albata]
MSGVRRSAAVLAAASLLVAGCGTSAPQGDPNAPLEVWTRSLEDTAKVYEKIFSDFTAKTGIKIDYKPVYNDFDKRMQERAASRDLPDLVITDVSALGVYQSQGMVTEIDRAGFAGGADLVERAWNNAKGADGKFYGVPVSTQAQATFIRKDWREKLGKPVPTTWAELVDLAKAFTTGDPDGNGQSDTYGMLVPGSTDRGYLAWWASSYLWQAGGDILAEEGGKYRVAVDSPGTVAAVEWLRGMFCDTVAGGHSVVQPGALTTITNDAHTFFEQGKAGIYLTGPYMMGRFDKAPGKDKYEVIASPKGPHGSTVLGEGENMYLMAGSARPADQKKLAEFMVSPDAQKAGMQGVPRPVVRLPVNSKVDVNAVYNDPRWSTVAKVYAESARPFPNVPNFQPFRQQTAETLNALFARCGTDIRAELGKLAANLNKELKSQGMAK